MRTVPRCTAPLSRPGSAYSDDARDEFRSAVAEWAVHVAAGRIGGGIAADAVAAGEVAAAGAAPLAWPPVRFGDG